jgi:hypothetical protein
MSKAQPDTIHTISRQPGVMDKLQQMSEEEEKVKDGK